MRMDCMSTMLGNGRSISAKAGSHLMHQHQKQEWKSIYRNSFNKSLARESSYSWPLLVFAKRSLEERTPRFLGIDSPIVAGSSLHIVFATTVGSEEKASELTEDYSGDPVRTSSGGFFGLPVDRTELEALHDNTIRAKLIRKLSEANQYNRHLQRQIHYKEKALNKCKNELAVMDLELQALVALAKEVAKNGAKFDSRKINGRYVHSHLVVRLEELRVKLLEQIKDVDAVQFREVPLVWYGMAEDVKIMGSFDGWTYGEQMSPESSASFTKFSTTLKLRPGRYEIKFLVDGEWQVSPEFQSVGEGPMTNNLLVVE
ncbi:protein PTST, chloroplastic isoform X1 [Cryptomeria japonica]|uniref:protein PTST, chloroplastic isoform X1 n=2 Tax=Cryptomeria japonica TaxID=3369 RepID=UPI0027DA8EF6|nr:protein PTST, chloroplastic isoform X1 [Cryptomeria japonica]